MGWAAGISAGANLGNIIGTGIRQRREKEAIGEAFKGGGTLRDVAGRLGEAGLGTAANAMYRTDLAQRNQDTLLPHQATGLGLANRRAGVTVREMETQEKYMDQARQWFENTPLVKKVMSGEGTEADTEMLFGPDSGFNGFQPEVQNMIVQNLIGLPKNKIDAAVAGAQSAIAGKRGPDEMVAALNKFGGKEIFKIENVLNDEGKATGTMNLMVKDDDGTYRQYASGNQASIEKYLMQTAGNPMLMSATTLEREQSQWDSYRANMKEQSEVNKIAMNNMTKLIEAGMDSTDPAVQEWAKELLNDPGRAAEVGKDVFGLRVPDMPPNTSMRPRTLGEAAPGSLGDLTSDDQLEKDLAMAQAILDSDTAQEPPKSWPPNSGHLNNPYIVYP